MRALDLFSAAAGGWTLGLHRAGFITVAACEIIEWRRILYAENNPHVLLYDDIRALTATRLLSDLGVLPDIIVGSPPCQDISVANTKGRGIDGERSGLYLEAVRLVGDCRPRWFAFENSAHLRTRGADRLLDALAAIGYACEPCVVAAGDIGANHVRKRSWLIGYDPGQLADTGIQRCGTRPRDDQGSRRETGGYESANDTASGSTDADAGDASQVGRRTRRARRRAQPVAGSCQPSRGHVADAGETERRQEIDGDGNRDRQTRERIEGADRHTEPAQMCSGDAADANEARSADGRLESGLRSPQIAIDGCGDERRDEIADADRQSDGAVDAEMGRCAGAGGDAADPWAVWNGGLAGHLRVDDGLSAWVAGTRVAIGNGKRPSAASLIVEAFGDAVLPQIPEAIGRAILRTERALDAVLGLHRSRDLIGGGDQ
ncbi:DNA cytosine methyltransferase [Sphingomonas sp. CL5.1]|uniref:DNA cytosine methyltransferase n=1 Tax=Sphingomonas sp. CL5.1 TaxID=2653203 RepID=UPI0015818E87|nr:DNA cytosine methyltransferase [Sphingomonas sp. CL5.1]QKR98274.1 DNA cytosine methyltransferase [Sphingomonas sp. CL5.1]